MNTDTGEIRPLKDWLDGEPLMELTIGEEVEVKGHTFEITAISTSESTITLRSVKISKTQKEMAEIQDKWGRGDARAESKGDKNPYIGGAT